MSKYKDDILRLKAEGKTYKEITEQLGCTKSTVCYYVGTEQQNKAITRQKSRRDKIQKFIQEYKQGRPCTDCGEYYPYWVMDFDHLGNKEFGISGRKGGADKNIEAIKAEIAKCEVVCSNCHRNRTFSRLQGKTEWTEEFYE